MISFIPMPERGRRKGPGFHYFHMHAWNSTGNVNNRFIKNITWPVFFYSMLGNYVAGGSVVVRARLFPVGGVCKTDISGLAAKTERLGRLIAS